MKRIILLATLIFSACQAKNITSQPQTAELAASNQSTEIAVQSVAPERLISARGIGKAKLGMTLGRLKKISDPDTVFEVVPSFMVDVDAIAVSKKGIVQYYILYLADNNENSNLKLFDRDRVITALMTNNDDYQTEKGIKVGTPIKEAEKAYGNAVLAYNTEGESREYVTFGGEHPENIQFRASYFKLISDGMGFSGIYPEYPGVSYTTDKYHSDAAIAAIEVSCNSEDCIN